MLQVSLVQLAKLVKFAGVLLFVGGAIASFVASEPAARRAAVHRIGSIGISITWAGGFLLASMLRWPLGELWLVGATATTLAIHLVLTWSVAGDGRRTRGPALAVAALVAVALAFMIWKPTWQMVR